MGKDVEFDIVAHDKSGGQVRQSAQGLERLGDKADKAARKVDELGDQTGQLAKKLLEARAAAVLLAKQFDATGDSKILKDFQKANAEAGKLGRVLKSLKIDAPEIKNPDGFLGAVTKLARKAGLIAGDAAIDGLGSLLKALPPQVQAGLVVGGTAAAAVMGAAVEGAILAGIGAAAIGGTVLLAAQNEKVKEQYSILGSAIMLDLKDAGKPMEEQLLGSVPKLSAAFERELPTIRRITSQAASDFGPVLDGVLAAAHAILPSLERAAAVGGKILGSVAGQLPALAGSIGHLLDAFSDSGRGAADGLNEMILNVRVLIEALALLAQAGGPALNTIGRISELMGLAPQAGGRLTTLASAQDRAAFSAAAGAAGYDQLSQSLGNTANMARQLQSNFDALFGSQMAVDQANLAVNVGMSQLRETIKGNKKTLDESTESGQQNTQVILAQIQALDQKRQADIAAGNGTAEATAKANAAYASNVAALRSVLIQLGLAPAAVDALIAAYQRIPKTITTTITTVYRTIGSPGQSDQSTGHSRAGAGADTSALSGWAPARYADAQRADMRDGGGGTFQTGGPTEVHSEVSVSVSLDGEAIQPRINRTVKSARKRDAWRAKVGRR